MPSANLRFLSLRAAAQFHVRLIHEELIAVRVRRLAGGHVVDSAALGVEDDGPEGGPRVRGAGVVEQARDGVRGQRVLAPQGERLAVELGREVAQRQGRLFRHVAQGAEPVGEAEGGGAAGGHAVVDARGLVLAPGAEEGARDDGAQGLRDKERGEAPVEVGVVGDRLPGRVDGGHLVLAAEAELVRVLDDVAGRGLRADGEVRDDAEAGAGAAQRPEQVGVFVSAGRADVPVGRDDLHREDVVEGCPPHPG